MATARKFGLGYAFEKSGKQRLQSLQLCINYLSKYLTKSAVTGLSCNTNDIQNLLHHLMVASYIADMLKAEELLALKETIKFQSPAIYAKKKRESFESILLP